MVPSSATTSQRITVPSCAACNEAYSADETKARSTLLLASSPNAQARELWEGPVSRSWRKKDGTSQLLHAKEKLTLVETGEVEQYLVKPADCSSVVRVVKKISHGLAVNHGLTVAPLREDLIACRPPLTLPIPLERSLTEVDGEPGVYRYRYMAEPTPGVSSFWELTFYDRIKFMCTVISDQRLFESSFETNERLDPSDE